MNREELLAEAQRRYIDGCVFEIIDGLENAGSKRIAEGGLMWGSNDNIHFKLRGIGAVYYQGKWAKIISTPQPQEDVTKMEKKPQFVRCINGNKSSHYTGRIYKVENGKISCESTGSPTTWNGYGSGGFRFEDSTKEEYDAQFVAAQEDNWEPRLGDSVVNDSGMWNSLAWKDCDNYGDIGRTGVIESIVKEGPVKTWGLKIAWHKGGCCGKTVNQVRKALPHEIPSNQEPVVPTYVEQAKAYQQAAEASKYEDFGRAMEDDIAEFYEKHEPATDELKFVVSVTHELYRKKKTILLNN